MRSCSKNSIRSISCLLAPFMMLMLSSAAFAYTVEMTIQAPLEGAEQIQAGNNTFPAGYTVNAIYPDALFSGTGSRNSFLALAFAGSSLVYSGIDTAHGAPALTMKQGRGSRFVIAVGNATLEQAGADLSSGSVHKSRYGNYAPLQAQKLVYLYARIAGLVLKGGIFPKTAVRNRGGAVPEITLERG